jgi:hypothetical protein
MKKNTIKGPTKVFERNIGKSFAEIFCVESASKPRAVTV